MLLKRDVFIRDLLVEKRVLIKVVHQSDRIKSLELDKSLLRGQLKLAEAYLAWSWGWNFWIKIRFVFFGDRMYKKVLEKWRKDIGVQATQRAIELTEDK